MKRFIVFLACLGVISAQANSLFDPWALTSDLITQQWGDSYEVAQFANMNDVGIDNAVIMMNPGVMVRPRTGARSGGNNLEELTRIAEYGVPNYWYSKGTTNVWDLIRVSSNGSFPSNQVFDYVSKEILAPSWLTNQANAFALSSWPYPTNKIWRTVIGDFPQANLDFTLELRSLGGSNAAVVAGYEYLDSWDSTLTNIVATQNTLGINHYFPGGHPDRPYQFIWQMILLRQLNFPTNVFTAVMDWNSLTPSRQDFCSVSSVSHSGNNLSFTLTPVRQGPAFDVPMTNSIGGITQTNDVRAAFALYPAIQNYCQEILRVTNCPSGKYIITMHGTNWIQCSDLELKAGINIWTNYDNANELFMNAVRTLALQRTQRDVNPTNASDVYDPLSNFANSVYQSYASARWSTNVLGADYYGGLMQDREQDSLVVPWDGNIHTSAQQAGHAIAVQYVGFGSRIRMRTLK
jgi:hypothetical protein